MQLINAPAKINLALHVTGQRVDGYHLIDTLVVFADTVEASDTIVVSKAPVDGFNINGPLASSLCADNPEGNLAIKTRDHVRLSAFLANHTSSDVHISLEKRLPVAAGLGGGSADAAATLRALHIHWGIRFDPAYSSATILAQKLGADVPMCLLGKPLRATGIGELIRRVDNVPTLHMVLVNCGASVSTPDIFEALENKENTAIFDLPDDPHDFVDFLKSRTRNDLQVPAIRQCAEIKQQLMSLNEQGALMSRMSGSGATCFGIFESAAKASEAAESIAKAQPDWWVLATRTAASPKG